ncbi:MAG: hypothetical protein JXA35_01565 [Deltaproteobacteria bacterium]|nr:hypothetical protein [Deltaproteobacteria bacterium]
MKKSDISTWPDQINSTSARIDIPVLLLHNIDPSWEPFEIKTSLDDADRLKSALEEQGHVVSAVAVDQEDLSELLEPFDPFEWVVFNWCEEIPGSPRSDWRVVSILESMRFTYTGSSAHVLKRSWDKAGSKRRMDSNGIPTPRWTLCGAPGPADWNCFPAIVKPAYEHCSVGINPDAVVLDQNHMLHRIGHVERIFRQPALIEDFIDGREFHVTLWGNGDISMLPPAEMDFSAFGDVCDRLCTWDSKFIPGSVHYEKIEMKIPAPLDTAQLDLLRSTTVHAYRVFGCRDYARVDLRLRDGVFYVLDVNPNADLSPDTSMVYAAQHEGLNYGQVASRLINLAAGRHPMFSKYLETQVQAEPVTEGIPGAI